MTTATGPVIPTGYEGQMTDIAQKREIAKALLAAGMSRQQMTSPFQLLGSLAQTWAGKSVNNDATKEQEALDSRRLQDFQMRNNLLAQAVSQGQPVDRIAQQFGNDPSLANSPVMKAIVDAYGEKLKNQQSGTITELKGPDGFKTGIVDKTGNFSPTNNGYSLPGKIENVNNVAYDLQHTAPGTVLPQPASDIAIIGPDGKITPNQAAIAGKSAVAAAGRPVTNTYVNAMDKSFGKVIPEATIKDLTTSRETALNALKARGSLQEASAAINSGKIFTGTAANARLAIAKGADLFGVGGTTAQERITNSENFLRSMGQQMFPILAALRPASDTDVETARKMTGGDLSLSTDAIKSAIRAAQMGGEAAISSHQKRVGELSKVYGSNPELAQGLQTFAIEVPQGAPAAPSSAGGSDRLSAIRAELARRRGGR